MIQPRCAICDADRDGAVWPESAESLCAAHWLLASVRSLVRCGAWSEFDADKWGRRPNHRDMMRQPPSETQTPRTWRAVVLALLTVKGVYWDDGSGDSRDSLTDRYTLLSGLVPAWVYAEMVRAMVEQRKGRAA
jgi:hypothetical protein